MKTRVLGAVVALACPLHGGCGSAEPFCGDGHLDPAEGCDDGNDDDTDFCLSTCQPRAVPRLTVTWEFNQDVVDQFSGDSCIDLGARRVQVEITGSGQTFTAEESCSFRQVVFTDIPAAEYSVRLEVLGRDEEALTAGVVARSYQFAGGSSEKFLVNVMPQEWAVAYSGTFFFRLQWSGKDCAAAAPPVVEHMLTLAQRGKVLSVTTLQGDRLDGSAPGRCRSVMEASPHAALRVPFGFSVLSVEGRDSTGRARYLGTFETFVGAGAGNPEMMFDVDAVETPPI